MLTSTRSVPGNTKGSNYLHCEAPLFYGECQGKKTTTHTHTGVLVAFFVFFINVTNNLYAHNISTTLIFTDTSNPVFPTLFEV